MRKQNGQLMVEFVLSVGLISSFLGAFVLVSELSSIRDKVLEAARAGTRLQAEGLDDSQRLNEIVKNLLPKQLSIGEADWQVRLGRYSDTPASSFYDLRETHIDGNMIPRSSLLASFSKFHFDERLVQYKRTKESIP